MGARWYDPALSRWLSADTLVPGEGNPQALNRYSYVLGNPLRYIDPSGHAQICLGNGKICTDEGWPPPLEQQSTGSPSPPVIVLGIALDWLDLVFEGNAIHMVIEVDYMTRYPGSIGTDVVGKAGWGIAGAGPEGGYGYPDIIDIPKNMLWEIKGPSGVAEGVAQVKRYEKSSAYLAGTGYVGTTLNHPYVPGWQVVTTQAAPGVIQYTVVRSQPVPIPVPIPDRAREGAKQRSLNLTPASVPAPVPVPAWSPPPPQVVLYWALAVGGGGGLASLLNRPCFQ